MPWYEPQDPTPREQCPCCGYISLPERGMSLICPICFWEDDAFVGDAIDCRSLCNNMTLRQARSSFDEIGACDRRMLANVLSVPERAKFRRASLPVEKPNS